MIFYTIYNSNTGEILFTGNVSNEEEITNNIFSGQSYILELSNENQYVENGILVLMPPKPDGEYLFDYATKNWVFNEGLACAKALYQRDQLLREGPDRISPIWWASMTSEQQQSWLDYRQALLDITNQPSFPLEVSWPTKPA